MKTKPVKSGRSTTRVAMFSLALSSLLALPSSAEVVAFDNNGGGGDLTWENPLNWDNDLEAIGIDTIAIPAGFDVTRASTFLLDKTDTPPGTLDIQAGASLTITGELQMQGAPAAVNIAGSLIFTDENSRTMSHTVDTGNQGTYSLSGLMRFNDYENGFASGGGANGAPLLDFIQVGASMEALGMDAEDFTNLNDKLLSSTSFFFGINGTQVNNTGTPTDATGADIVEGLYLARTETADSVTLTLTAAPGPWIALPAEITVGNNGTTETIDVSVSNAHDTVSLDITAIDVTGTNAGLFTVTSATSLTLAPGTNSTITLEFNPGAVTGPIDALLEVESNNLGTPGAISTVPITGSVRDPWISTDDSFALGPFPIGAGVQPFTVTVSNLGGLNDLVGEGAFLSGPNADNFAIVTDFTSTVGAGGNVDVDLTFDAGGAVGTFTATLELDSNDAEEPTRFITLTAEVIHDPVISVPEYVVVGPFMVGVSGPQSFTVQVDNLGAAANLTLSPAPMLVGGDAANFSITGTDTPLTPGGSGLVSLNFTPPVSSKANYATTLRIESNDQLTPSIDVLIFANVVKQSAPNLVLHYELEEGSGDTMRDAVSGVDLPTDSADWVSPGIGGLPGSTAALDFTLATNPASRVDETVPAGFSGIAGSGDRTVTAWINTSDAGRNMIIAWGSSWGETGDLGQRSSFMLNGSALRFEIGGGFATGTANIADGGWHHIAISTTGTDTANTVFWVDGVLDATATFGNANPIDSIAQWVSIGGENQPGAGQERFQGALDDVRVYDKVLTEAEIGDLLAPAETIHIDLAITGFDSGTGILSVTATNIPVGQTFHLEQSTDLQSFGILSPVFDFDSTTPQPFEIPVDPGTNPALFLQVFEGPSIP